MNRLFHAAPLPVELDEQVEHDRQADAMAVHPLVAANAALTFAAVHASYAAWGSGAIERPRDAGMMFMLHRPYLPPGSLRAAIAYPEPPPGVMARMQGARVRLSWGKPRLSRELAGYHVYRSFNSADYPQTPTAANGPGALGLGTVPLAQATGSASAGRRRFPGASRL